MRLFGTRVTLAAAIGILVIVAMAGGSLLAPWIAPYDPNLPLGGRWDPPSPEHWLGLDQIGRDMFSRVLYGGRISIGLALLATLLAFIVGTVTAFAGVMFGGWVDIGLSRIADIILCIPVLISALIVISGFGATMPVLVVAIGLLCSVQVFRVARSVAMNIAVLEYAEIARLRGEGPMWVIMHEILPNALPRLAAEFGLRFCLAFLFIAALSFLGLGVQLPDADWGGMVKESALAIPAGIAAPLYPAGAIALLSIGMNLVVGWLLSTYSGPQGENVMGEAA
jgi:peptide/nickel transport system permease protein